MKVLALLLIITKTSIIANYGDEKTESFFIFLLDLEKENASNKFS